jgi:hypothetical protein
MGFNMLHPRRPPLVGLLGHLVATRKNVEKRHCLAKDGLGRALRDLHETLRAFYLAATCLPRLGCPPLALVCVIFCLLAQRSMLPCVPLEFVKGLSCKTLRRSMQQRLVTKQHKN